MFNPKTTLANLSYVSKLQFTERSYTERGAHADLHVVARVDHLGKVRFQMWIDNIREDDLEHYGVTYFGIEAATHALDGLHVRFIMLNAKGSK